MKSITFPDHLHFIDSEEFQKVIISRAKGQKTALFLSETAALRLNLRELINNLEKNAGFTWIKAIPANPNTHDLTTALRTLHDSDFDLFIAIGGGSALDLSKACAALLWMNVQEFEDQEVTETILSKRYLAHISRPKLIGVPTTAGTGSELTPWATIWDLDQERKYSVETPHLAFDEAYIVVSFTLTMPPRLTLSSGLDALVQATEAYWAKPSTSSVQRVALQAIREIVENLPKVLADPGDLKARKQVMIGSIYGAMAFSKTKTTACHSISYPLTLKFKIDHGLGCALTLGDIMKHNLHSIVDYQRLFDAFKVTSPEELTRWIEKTAHGIASMKLSDYGITAQDLDELAALSFTLGRMDNNPVELTLEEVKNILKRHL